MASPKGEAIQSFAQAALDCFVAIAPRNDEYGAAPPLPLRSQAFAQHPLPQGEREIGALRSRYSGLRRVAARERDRRGGVGESEKAAQRHPVSHFACAQCLPTLPVPRGGEVQALNRETHVFSVKSGPATGHAAPNCNLCGQNGG